MLQYHHDGQVVVTHLTCIARVNVVELGSHMRWNQINEGSSLHRKKEYYLIGTLLPDEVTCNAQRVLIDCYELISFKNVQRRLCDLPAYSR